MSQVVWWGHLVLTVMLAVFLVCSAMVYNGMRCHGDYRTHQETPSHPRGLVVLEAGLTLGMLVTLACAWYHRRPTLYLCTSLPVWVFGFAFLNHVDRVTERSPDRWRALRLPLVLVVINLVFCCAVRKGQSNLPSKAGIAPP